MFTKLCIWWSQIFPLKSGSLSKFSRQRKYINFLNLILLKYRHNNCILFENIFQYYCYQLLRFKNYNISKFVFLNIKSLKWKWKSKTFTILKCNYKFLELSFCFWFLAFLNLKKIKIWQFFCHFSEIGKSALKN